MKEAKKQAINFDDIPTFSPKLQYQNFAKKIEPFKLPS